MLAVHLKALAVQLQALASIRLDKIVEGFDDRWRWTGGKKPKLVRKATPVRDWKKDKNLPPSSHMGIHRMEMGR